MLGSPTQRRRRPIDVKVLLVGVGGVGEVIALVSKGRPFLERMVLSDFALERAEEVQGKLGDDSTFPVERVDASDPAQIVGLAETYDVDLVLNATTPVFNESIFGAAFECGRTYLDMALSLPTRHPTDPYRLAHVKLGDYQFERSPQWEEKGLLALVGMGVDPGLSDVFAAYAAKHLFDRIDEIGVRDGSDIEIEGYEFAPGFSIWTTIEECLNPPVVWERPKGWFTTPTFSEPEVFDFPGGVGPVECVNVEHEEVVMVPRWIDCERVTFKYGLGERFIEILKTLELLGLDSKEPMRVKDVEVAPRDVVTALLPDPAHLGDRMVGKTCVGTWVTGEKDGAPKAVFLYQSTDNQECMAKLGSQAVVYQTGVNPVIAMELLSEGIWKGAGVLGPEAFDPDPYLERTAAFDYPWGIVEMAPSA
jgi:saccharopine dehydrogenase (NAD+, L-lysine-forming)